MIRNFKTILLFDFLHKIFQNFIAELSYPITGNTDQMMMMFVFLQLIMPAGVIEIEPGKNAQFAKKVPESGKL